MCSIGMVLYSYDTIERSALDLDLVWIRLFRPVRAIAEPWDEGDGVEWAKMAVDRVTWQWLFGMPTPALCRGRLPSHWRPPLPGGGSRAATYPVADSHQTRVNDGRTEERGTVIQRINRDLTKRSACCCGVLWCVNQEQNLMA